jgi:predicted AAA+ superfamily ATPase
VRKEAAGTDGTLSMTTLREYLTAMQRIFLIEKQPAWNPHMRSRSRLVKASKWHFSDPSIAMAALNASSDALLMDFNAFGLLFESLCIRDVRVYSQPLDGAVSYFRDSNGNEVDVIVELPGGKWGAIEVKLGIDYIDEGAKSLLKLRDNIDTKYMKQPSFLMVLTAGQLAYRRPDGVLVVPLGCLRD